MSFIKILLKFFHCYLGRAFGDGNLNTLCNVVADPTVVVITSLSHLGVTSLKRLRSISKFGIAELVSLRQRCFNLFPFSHQAP